MAISAATIKSNIQKMLSNKRLIDLTNQDVANATTINDDFFDQAITESERLFNTVVGDESNEQYSHDIGALEHLVIFFLFAWARDSQSADFYLTLAKQYLVEALGYRLNIDLTIPENQRSIEFTNRAQMINNLPVPHER